MQIVERRELVQAARGYLRPYLVGDRLLGDVAAIVTSASGARYAGVCLDTASGTGFCAEHAAAAAMVTAGEYRIASVVAVWQGENGVVYVLPPCGRCRLFLSQLDPSNLDALVLLSGGRNARLRDLLPESEWPPPEEEINDRLAPS